MQRRGRLLRTAERYEAPSCAVARLGEAEYEPMVVPARSGLLVQGKRVIELARLLCGPRLRCDDGMCLTPRRAVLRLEKRRSQLRGTRSHFNRYDGVEVM